MKHFLLMAAFFANCALAESTASVSSVFQPMVVAPAVNCGGSVTNAVKCSEPTLKSEMSWTNASINDWAGTIMRVQLNFVSNAAGGIAGVVQFSYKPEDKLVAIAIKQSSGTDDLLVFEQMNDFTDVEGRRIISFEAGHAIEFQLRVNVPYAKAGQVLKKDFMVEVEPIEYLQ
jgi:hypothetical protein